MNKVFLSCDYIYFFSEKKQKYLLINVASKEIYKINHAVANMLRLCNGKLSPEEIIRKYGNKSEAKLALDNLISKGIIITDDYRKKFLEKCYFNSNGSLIPRFDTIYIGLTLECNLSCSFCCAGKAKHSGQIDKMRLLEIGEEIKNTYQGKPLPVICFTGGEPLISRDFINIANEFYQMGFKLCLLTNGTLIDNNNFHELKIFHDIAISLDSTNELQHEKFRGNISGCYKKTINALRILEKNNIANVWIQAVIGKGNLGEMEKLAKLAKDIHLYGVRFGIIHSVGKAAESKDSFLDEQELITYYKNLYALKELYPEIKINESLSLNKPLGNHIVNSSCRLHNSCFINQDGRMSICPGFLDEGDFSLENLCSKSFSDVVKSCYLISYYKSHLLEDIEPCSDCGVRYICFGGCRGEKEECNSQKKGAVIKCIESMLA